MNKGQRLYKFILGLLMPFLFLACSSKERIKIDGGTFNVDGKDVQLISLRSSINIIRAVRILWRNFIRPGSMCGDSAIRQSTINALPSNSIGCWDKAYPLVCICSTEEQISGT